jgi:hypothetical protein
MAARRAPARRKPRQIDWRRVAELLVQNTPVSEVARKIGCSRSAISRKRNHDPIFQDWLHRLRTLDTQEPAERLAELRRSLHAAIDEQIGKGNARIIVWLAERLTSCRCPASRRRWMSCAASWATSPPTSCGSSRAFAIRPEPDDYRSSGAPEGCTIRSRPS